MENQIIVVDTDVLIDGSRNANSILADHLKSQLRKKIKLIISAVSVFEFLSGTYFLNKQLYNKACEFLKNFSVQDVNKKIAEIAARINRENNLFKQIDLADILIGATSLYFNSPILTFNKKHFRLIPGLKFAE